MFSFIVGVVVGAAFAPFWMKLYALGKQKLADKGIKLFDK
jgi:hypothetical protein